MACASDPPSDVDRAASVAARGADWLPEFSAEERLSPGELRFLRSSFEDWQDTLASARRSKPKTRF